MNKLKSFEDHLDKYRSKKGTDSRAEYVVKLMIMNSLLHS